VFDFIDHRLDVTDDAGGSFTMPLEAMSVAAFYREFIARLGDLGIRVSASVARPRRRPRSRRSSSGSG
jgi:hypothetical protein